MTTDKKLTNNPLLQGLNPQQQEAVLATEGYVRVIAGAGSGKTKTLAHRFAHLVNDLGVNPANILCITFTNKAAQEMRTRVRQLVNMGNINDLICTYHGFGVRILREDINKLGYPSSFTIMDEEDQKSIMREIYEELHLKQSDLTFAKVLKYISATKQRPPLGIYPDYVKNYIDLCDDAVKDKFIRQNDDLQWQCFVKYLQKQKKGFLLDFDDLMYYASYILETHDDVLQKWQKRLDYIMVDETPVSYTHLRAHET